MSAEAVTVVLHHSRAEGTAKLVLWGIANHHSDAGAWPSIATLAKYAAVSERRVQQIIRELSDLGEIAIEEQGGLGQRQYKTNRYHILIQCPSDCDGSLNHKTGVKSGALGVQPVSFRGETQGQSGVKPVSPEPNREPNKNLYTNTEVLFEKFWAEYPRKVDRGAALKAFAKALKHASFEEILTGAIGYANDPNRKPEFTKYPASWLNAQSWLNQVTVSDELPKRTERERERTRAIIAETKEAEAKSAPPPKCPHGDNVALCKKCFR
jgi:hypothetical protein